MIWKFKASGNANMVYSNGQGKVLRIPKDEKSDVRFQLAFSQLIVKQITSSSNSLLSTAKVVDLRGNEFCLIPPVNNIFAVEMDDVSMKISFELKPKSGVIDLIAESMNACLYCLYEAEKLCTDYCPFMLYEEDLDTIAKGMELILGNPKKHFRLHNNGNVLSCKEAIASGLVDHSVVSQISEIIHDSRVLGNLRMAQVNFHQDIGKVFKFRRVAEQFTLESPTITEIEDLIATLNKKSALTPRQTVLSYLITRTLRDLSLIITIHNFSFPVRNSIKGQLHSGIKYTIDIIDLDMKPLKKIDDYYKDALRAYIEYEKKGVQSYCLLRNLNK